jgi:HK97 family phage portal protein
MGFLTSVKRAFTKSLNFISLTDRTDAGLITLLGRDYTFGTQSKDYLLKAYGSNPFVYTAVDRIVSRMVEADKQLLNRRGEVVEDLEFIELFKRPNLRESGDSLLYRAAATYLAAGECFVIRHQRPGEDDQYFVPVNYNVIINQDTAGIPFSYRVTLFGNSEVYLPGDVLHISKPDITLDTNHGFSALRAIRQVWESNNEVWKSEASLHRNKGITGVLYSDGNRPMTDTEQKQLQDKYEKDHTGSGNFGKVKVSTSKLGYIQMGMNPNDLRSIESRVDHLRAICAALNVDSKLFGDPGASTYNNMAEAKQSFILDAVLPLADKILPKLTPFIARSQLKYYEMQLDESKIAELQVTKEKQSARVGREVIQGILTPRQALEILYPEKAAEIPTPEQDIEERSEGDSLENNPAAESANDQAQANLRGSVGGVQGILQIQASVINGTTPRDSAIAILMTIYGFTEETANEILGNEN